MAGPGVRKAAGLEDVEVVWKGIPRDEAEADAKAETGTGRHAVRGRRAAPIPVKAVDTLLLSLVP